MKNASRKNYSWFFRCICCPMGWCHKSKSFSCTMVTTWSIFELVLRNDWKYQSILTSWPLWKCWCGKIKCALPLFTNRSNNRANRRCRFEANGPDRGLVSTKFEWLLYIQNERSSPRQNLFFLLDYVSATKWHDVIVGRPPPPHTPCGSFFLYFKFS